MQEAYRDSLATALPSIWPCKRAQRLCRRLLFNDIKEPGLNYLGNMICLSPAMHGALRRGDLALRPNHPLQDTYSGNWVIDLTVYWMTPDASERYRVGQSKSTSTARQPVDCRKGQIQAAGENQPYPVMSGEIISISAGACEDLPDYEILLLQWDIMRFASLCGGAMSKEHDGKGEEDEEKDDEEEKEDEDDEEDDDE